MSQSTFYVCTYQTTKPADFLVWDELNSSEEFAQESNSYDEEQAAIDYAEEDSDGNSDGLYYNYRNNTPGKHPILVKNIKTGIIKRYFVGIIEFEPVFAATEEK